MRVAIAERERFGGTCVNTGCIPTKALVASTYVAHKARHTRDYGVNVEALVVVDIKAVKARKDAISRQSRDAIDTGFARWRVAVSIADTPVLSDLRQLRSEMTGSRPS